MRAWMDVATLTKTRSKKGRFVAQCAADLPCVLEAGMDVAFVPPRTDVPRRGVVAEVSSPEGRKFEVGFAGIDKPADLEALVGSHCLARRELVEQALEDDGAHALAGWRVLGSDGADLGLVSAVAENPAHDLLEVEGPDGKAHLVPLVDEFIAEVREDERVLVMDLPDGLLEL